MTAASVVGSYVGPSAGESTRSPYATFNSYTPEEGDLVVIYTTEITTGVAVTVPSGWVNPLGGTTRVESDAHGLFCIYHLVTADEQTAETTTYTATNFFNSLTFTCTLGCVIRGVDPDDVIDLTNTASATGNTTTPHVLAGLTGTATDSLTISGVCRDAGDGTYTTPTGWSPVAALTTTQAMAVFSLNSTTGGNVAAANTTPSTADEYASISMSFNPAPAAPPSATLTAVGGTLSVVAGTATGGLLQTPDTYAGDFSGTHTFTADEETWTSWFCNYRGGSSGMVVKFENGYHYQKPQVATSAGQTHASMVTTTKNDFGNFDATVRMKTIAQIRTGSTPNPWETAWFYWHYTDEFHYYALVLKTNGLQIEKKDNMISDDGAEIYLVDEVTPTVSIGNYQTVRVKQTGTNASGGRYLNVWIDGTHVVSGYHDTVADDNESLMNHGSFGLYNEDAEVSFNYLQVSY